MSFQLELHRSQSGLVGASIKPKAGIDSGSLLGVAGVFSAIFFLCCVAGVFGYDLTERINYGLLSLVVAAVCIFFAKRDTRAALGQKLGTEDKERLCEFLARIKAFGGDPKLDVEPGLMTYADVQQYLPIGNEVLKQSRDQAADEELASVSGR